MSGYVQGEDLFMNTSVSETNESAVWDYVMHFTSPGSQSLLSDVGFIPAITGLQLVDSPLDRLMTQAIIALAGGAAYHPVPEMNVYIAPMDNALRSVFENGVQPSAALQTAEDAVRASLDAVRSQPAPEP